MQQLHSSSIQCIPLHIYLARYACNLLYKCKPVRFLILLLNKTCVSEVNIEFYKTSTRKFLSYTHKIQCLIFVSVDDVLTHFVLKLIKFTLLWHSFLFVLKTKRKSQSSKWRVVSYIFIDISSPIYSQTMLF